jgi:hypothetical protein
VSIHDAQSLIKMAEQIARNIPDRAHLAQAVGEHMRTFWAPSMITELSAYVDEHPEEASAEVRGALKYLKQKEEK